MQRQKDERRWYVVQTYSGYENRVKADLEQRIATMGMENNIFNVLVPEERRIVVKDGKSREVSRKLFPSYVLVEMVLDEQSWHVVRHTPGVTAFVGAGTHPIPLSEDEVERLMTSLSADQVKSRINLSLGDTVTVISGPLAGQTARVVDILEDKAKVKITVNLFGRENITEVDYYSLERI